jgi:hypothetical protein
MGASSSKSYWGTPCLRFDSGEHLGAPARTTSTQKSTMKPVTITKLRARNFMGLESLDLDLPATGVIELLGKNTHGKTSILRGVDSLIVGQRACPDVAVRKGAKKGEFGVDFSDGVTVRRRWTNAKDRTASTLEIKQGEFERKKPQEYMDALAPVELDPVAFVQKSPRIKTETVLAMTDFGGFDLVANGKAEDERRQAFEVLTKERDRARRQIETDAEACSLAPDALVNVEGISNQLAAATAHNATQDTLEAAADAAHELLETEQVAIDTLLERKAELEEELKANVDMIEGSQPRLAMLTKSANVAARAFVKFEAQTTSHFEQQLATANGQNELFHARERLNKLKDETGDVIERRTRAELDILKLVEDRDKALAQAVFPVEGLTYNVPTRSLMLNGFPLTQASDREQIIVAFQMMIAQKPPLRTATARQGSSLDSEARAWLHEYAVANDWQILLEVVADTPPDDLSERKIWVDDVKHASPVEEEPQTQVTE